MAVPLLVIGNKNYSSWSLRPWLADAPVVLRFRTYEVELQGACRAYADAVLALPALQEWIGDAERETESLAQFEQYA